VRLICATHRDLQAEVAAGRFREDLFYRIHVFPIRVPPLAERLEDLPDLARHLLARLALQNRMPVPALGDGALRALAARPWPGNVRQLANVLQRAMLLATAGGCIEAEHVGTGEDPLARAVAGPQRGPLKQRLGELERLLVAQCLERCRGNRTRAAAELGISRQALLAKLKKMGLTE
jgi:two-component system response regulator HydG